MRAFVVLSLIAVASAGRLGYNYQPGVSGSSEYVSSGSGFNPVLAFGGGQGVSSGPGASFVSGNSGLGGEFGGQGQGSGISYGLSGGSIGSGLGGGLSYGSGGQSFGSGVNYGSGSIGSGLGSGISYGSGGQSFGSGINYGSGSIGSGLGGGISYGSGSGIGGGLGSGISYGSSGSVGGGVSYDAGTNRVIDGGLSKEYYIFSAPEEEVRQGENIKSISTYLKKNLRVIFIKAPENNGIHNAALQVARQATEDRTAIYVLSKEPDVSEIASQVQEISENVRAKPEVRFIRYRTPQDAVNAQRTIQQQYEALGGSSQSSNEGIAPVLNFASPAAVHSGHAHGHVVGGSPVLNFASASEQSSQSVGLGSSGLSSNNVVVKSDRDYLPPAVKK